MVDVIAFVAEGDWDAVEDVHVDYESCEGCGEWVTAGVAEGGLAGEWDDFWVEMVWPRICKRKLQLQPNDKSYTRDRHSIEETWPREEEEAIKHVSK